MKRVLTLILLAFLCLTGHAQQVNWQVDFHPVSPADRFTLTGVMTTESGDLRVGPKVVAFAGKFSDGVQSTTSLSVLPMPGNNSLFSTYLPDAFNDGGLLLQSPIGVLNVSSNTTLIGTRFVNNKLTSVFLTGTITLVVSKK